MTALRTAGLKACATQRMPAGLKVCAALLLLLLAAPGADGASPPHRLSDRASGLPPTKYASASPPATTSCR
jgi:hypothetical protein